MSGSEVQKVEAKAIVEMDERGVQLRTIDEAYRFAQMVAKSGLAPASMKTPEQILVAIQTGAEVGMSPLRSLKSVYVINGTPSWSGKAAVGLIRQSGLCRVWQQGCEGDGDAMQGFVICQRIDEPEPSKVTFTIEQAKRAGLWGKKGPWSEYPDRMLMWRAVGHAADDHFSDVLNGNTVVEVVESIPARPIATPRAESPPASPDPLLTQATAIEAEVIEEECPPPDPGPVDAAGSNPALEDAPPEDWQPEHDGELPL